MDKYSDPLDQAAETEAAFTQYSIEAVLRKGNVQQKPFKGRCYNCDEPLERPHRFCDEDCLIDWERIEKAKQRNGYPGAANDPLNRNT